MARNGQGGGQGGQNPPKVLKVKCPRCDEEVDKNDRCGKCGVLMEVVCPNTACGKTVANAPNCCKCGTVLPNANAKPATPKQQEKVELEVSTAVKDGKGSVRIQVTRDGKAEKNATVWIGISGDRVKCYDDKTIVGGTITPATGAKPVQKMKTDSNGLLVLSVNFDGQPKVAMLVSVAGTQVDLKWPVTLSGPRFTFSALSTNWWTRRQQRLDQMKEARKYNQSH
jgi:hypothetical protein